MRLDLWLITELGVRINTVIGLMEIKSLNQFMSCRMTNTICSVRSDLTYNLQLTEIWHKYELTKTDGTWYGYIPLEFCSLGGKQDSSFTTEYRESSRMPSLRIRGHSHHLQTVFSIRQPKRHSGYG